MLKQHKDLVKSFRQETYDGFTFSVKSVEEPTTNEEVRACIDPKKGVKMSPPEHLIRSRTFQTGDTQTEKDATLTRSAYTAHCAEVGVHLDEKKGKGKGKGKADPDPAPNTLPLTGTDGQ